MAQELAYVIITPYSLHKSRTGGILARLITRTGLELVGARMFADEMAGAVTVAKVNIDDSPMTPSRLGVKGIPTLMLFRDGEMTSMKVGPMPKGKLVEWLAEAGVTAG